MLRVFGRFVAVRVGLLAAVAAFAAGHRCASHAPGAPTLDKLGVALGRAVGGTVSPDAITWGPSLGVVGDLVVGREVVFVGAPADGKPDVFRARFSVTPEGQPLRLSRVENLTRTVDAAEQGLLAVSSYVGYSTVTAAGATSLSLVDLDATRSAAVSTDSDWGSCLWRECLPPLSALHLAFDPVGSLSMIVDPPRLRLKLGGGAELEHDLGDAALPDWKGVEVWRGELDGGDLPETAAREFVFPWRRALREVQPPPDVTPKPARTEDGVQWPPPHFEPLLASAPATEGTWRPSDGQSDEATLLVTQLSLDPLRPESRLQLVAIDVRRLEPHLQGGVQQPRGTLGPPGTGRLPETQHVVAVFGGGTLEPDSTPALKVEGRTSSPPVELLPSVVITQRGDIGLGRWPKDLQADAVLSYRQSPPLLIDGGSSIVRGAGEHTVTAQAALCRTSGGHLLYAWSNHASRAALSLGLIHAGCQTALALDATSGGFAKRDEAGSTVWRAVSEAIATPPWLERGVAERDFFYLAERPQRLELGGLDWVVSPGAQPAPTLLPAILGAPSSVGELQLELVTIAPERVSWSVLGGGSEPLLPGRAAPTRELAAEEAERVLFAFDVGHTTRATRYGLAFGERETLPLRPNYATLVVSDAGLELAPAGQPPELRVSEQALQLPLLVSDGQLTERASHAGSHRRRGALCVAPDGRVLAAFSRHDSSAPLALELRRLGCDFVCELDRASQHQAEFYREGTRTGLPRDSATTLIVGLSKEMAQPTFELK